ncbi:MAG: aspartate aminotransferase family protein [Pseudomonadota bacterium]|nr:aspartate aminotransferase family protein [Pseudomonadota bacterium]
MLLGSSLTDLDASDSSGSDAYPDATHGLLNTDHTAAFEQAVACAASLLSGRLKSVEQPFSGILPAELAEYFNAVDLDEPLHSFNESLNELQSLYLNDAVYFHHPRYMAHLNCPIAYPAVAAELITAAVNSSVDTWDQSAGATLIEQHLIDWTARRIGFAGERADGVFTSGGTQSNLMALLLARDNYCLVQLNGYSIQRQGLPTEAAGFRILASRIAHFSLQKAAAILGLGADAIVPVDCDADYRMSPVALKMAIEQCRRGGHTPIAVVATLGSTDFGSIDPIVELAPICRQAGLWLHADAAYGCGLLVSRKARELLAGIEQADSVTVDFHKSFLQPVSCSAFMVRERAHLACLTYHADYLNPLSQTQEKTPNLVCKSLQTTRRFDALKLWMTLRVLGPDKLGEAFEHVMALAQAAYDLLAQDSDFEVLHRPALSTLVFRYRPAGVTDSEQLDQLNTAIRKALMREGRALVAATREAGRCYLKFTLLNPATTLADVRAVLDGLRTHGQALLDTASSAPQADARLFGVS